jgi:hypothetical protein
MLITAQNFTRQAVQNAFDEAAEHRGHQWAVDRLHKVLGVRSVDEVPEEKYMNAVGAFCGHMIGVTKPTAHFGPTINCRKPEARTTAQAMDDMADDIYAKQRNA